MLNSIENNDLIITTNNIKKDILRQLSKNKKIINIKIMTLQEFKDNYFGTYNKEAIVYLMRTYHYPYDIALKYLTNIFSNSSRTKELLEELEKNKLIIHNYNFKKNLKNIKLINIKHIDNYLKKIFANYHTEIIKEKEVNAQFLVYHFSTIEEEIEYHAQKITEELSSTPINDIHLVNVTPEYITPLKRIFRMYNIPLNTNDSSSIYSTNIAQKFLNSLTNSKNIEDAINSLPESGIKNQIVTIINNYAFTNTVDDVLISCFVEEFKRTKLSSEKLKNAIDIINFEDIIPNDNIYHILSFNQENVPKVVKDEDFISDQEKILLDISPSIKINKEEKDYIIKILKTTPNYILSYKDKTPFASYYPSYLINTLSMEIKDENTNKYHYSDSMNQYHLTQSLDNLIKYNEKDENLAILYHNYPQISYRTYNNAYTKINIESLKNYLKPKLTLAYSSLNNYYNCAFKYYINNILKLDPYEETFAIFIGNLFHDVLSKMYSDTFDLDIVYNEYIKNKMLTPKESFFINKLKEDLKFVIDTIKFQDSFTKLNNVLTEQKIFVNKSKDIEITFMGIVDKIKYTKNQDHIIAAIIDYKTGNIKNTLDNINYGLNLQLPVYIYLAKNKEFSNLKIAGFYLQHILQNKVVDQIDYLKDNRQKLRLSGYSNSNEKILSYLDDNYENSLVIEGMKKTSNGFSNYTKLINDENIEKISTITNQKIDEAIDNILNAEFSINPKRLNNDLIGCKYCKYKDLCFRKEEDIVDLDYQKIEDILGGEKDA